MLGFSVRPDDRKPGWRDLKVEVSGEQGNIRAGDGFYYQESPSPGPKTVHEAEMNGLASVLAYSALPSTSACCPQPLPNHARSFDACQDEGRIPGDHCSQQHQHHPSNANSLDLEIGAIARCGFCTWSREQPRRRQHLVWFAADRELAAQKDVGEENSS
jgi:hypothetical protein